MAKKIATNIDYNNLKENLKEIKNVSYSFEKHPLKDLSDYEKKMYVTFLFAIAASEGDLNEDGVEYIKKIINGVKIENDIYIYLKEASEITNEHVAKFIEAFLEKDLRFNFIFDSLMIYVLSGSKNEKTLELIADFVEVLKINENDLNIIINKLTKLINKEAGFLLDHLASENIFNLFYMLDFIFAEIRDYQIFEGEIKIDKDLILDKKTVIFYKAKVTISEHGKIITNNHSLIAFIDCEFKSDKSIAIRINNTENFMVRNCKFNSFWKRVIEIENCKNFEIKQSIFSFCGNKSIELDPGSKDYYGGVFYINLSNGKIIDCIIKNCKIGLGTTFGSHAYGLFMYVIDSKVKCNNVLLEGCYYLDYDLKNTEFNLVHRNNWDRCIKSSNSTVEINNIVIKE